MGRGGGPREIDCWQILMWFCQMVYAKVISCKQVDYSTILNANANSRAKRHNRSYLMFIRVEQGPPHPKGNFPKWQLTGGW